MLYKGPQKYGIDPHAPYDEWVEIEVRLKLRKAKRTIDDAVRMHDDEVRLDPYKHVTKGFDENFEHVDVVCFNFNNMGPYRDVKLVGVNEQCAPLSE